MSDIEIYRQLTRLPASSDSDNFLFADYTDKYHASGI